MYKPFSEELFHNPIDQITQSDLEAYFQQERDETLFLEFKSFTDKEADKRPKTVKDSERTKGVLKTINAFLNSSGGLLIWGAPEPQKVQRGERQVTICKGSLMPVPDYYDRDDFINKLAGQISPLPQSIRMHSVPATTGYVYLFEVQESKNKPHQYDGRYYVRMDTRTDVAPHYLVYALCRQIKIPELAMEVKFGRALTLLNSNTIDFDVYVEISNQTETVNEFDIYLKVNVSNGSIARSRHLDGLDFLMLDNVTQILSSGLPIKTYFNVKICIPVNDKAGEVLTVWYGGRTAPAKQLIHKIFFVNQQIQGTERSVTYEVRAEKVAEQVNF